MAAAAALREATGLVAQLAGLVVLAGTVAGVVAFLYRWYVREQVPGGLSLLFGLAAVAVYLNTSRALGQVIGGSTLPTEAEVALFNVAAFGLASGGAVLGRRAGDGLGADIASGKGRGVDSDVGRLVQSVGRIVTVDLPEDIDDAVGYDPIPEETKAKLAGKRFLFPRRLTVAELRERLVSRLRSDYAVGQVDVELAADGSVEYLALGSRAAGIGPTLPPATTAVAIRADPAFAASAGDVVQVWETEPMERVLTAELRGVAGETVTLAIDAADTPKVDPRKEYRLVTLPVDDRPDREFASLLRAADETFSSVTVDAGSPLHGLPVGALTPTVVAVRREDGESVALPDREYVLAPGETLFAIARPEVLRRLERAARPLDPSLVPVARHPETQGTDESGADGTLPPDARTGPAVASGTEAGSESGTDEPSDPTPAGDAVEPAADDSGTGGKPAAGRATGTDGTTADGSTDEASMRETTAGDAATGEPAAGDTATAGNEGTGGQAGASSFQELKSEFESGDADWDDGPEESAGVDVGGDDEDDDSGDASSGLDLQGDDLFGGDDSDDPGTGSEDPTDDLGLEVDDDTGSDSDDPEDGLAALDVGGEDDLGLDDDIGFGDGSDDEGSDDGGSDDGGSDDEGSDDEDSDGEGEGDGGGGGARSFQELKAEFESGDADWEDDVDDSPGGDMRLDE
jgi:hypothetical protein